MSGAEVSADVGEPDPAVAASLADYAAGKTSGEAVLSALCSSRLLVPVVATAVETATTTAGLTHDTSAAVAVVLFQRSDGQKALLCFTGLSPMRRWNPAARPTPLSVRGCAQAALDEGATAMLIDLEGPVRFPVNRRELSHLAAGHVLSPTSAGYLWLAPPGSTGPPSAVADPDVGRRSPETMEPCDDGGSDGANETKMTIDKMGC